MARAGETRVRAFKGVAGGGFGPHRPSFVYAGTGFPPPRIAFTMSQPNRNLS